jgi:hypothetical protein
MRLAPRTWAKLIAGVLVIGGVLVTLWATNHPTLPGPSPGAASPTPTPPALRRASATVVIDDGAVHRATIACDGARRAATGFWAAAPGRACDALAAARGGHLSGPGCTGAAAAAGSGARMRVTGSFGARRFDHRARRSGCPGWLAVNVLAAPVVEPDQQLGGASR